MRQENLFKFSLSTWTFLIGVILFFLIILPTIAYAITTIISDNIFIFKMVHFY